MAGLRKPDAHAVGCAGSLGDPEHLGQCAELALREFGRLDILVNNAATNAPYGPLMEADPGEWRHAFTARAAPARQPRCTSHSSSRVNSPRGYA